MSNDDREIRAFEAIIVSQLKRERDPMDEKDLPELTDAQKAAIKKLPANLMDQLWDEVSADDEEGCPEEECEIDVDHFQSVGFNRADEMDEETRLALEKARREVLESMIQKLKDQGGANS